jgi:threonine dehydratase
MGESVVSGRLMTTPRADTIADGIAVRVPIESAIGAVRAVTDEVLFVADTDIRRAVDLLHAALGLVVEPAGAAGLAAVLAAPERWKGQRIAIPLCGGNVCWPSVMPASRLCQQRNSFRS